MSVTSPKDNHPVSDEIRRVITFLLGHVTGRDPFMPSKVIRIRDIQSPHVVERSLTVTATKNDQKVAIQNCGVGSTRGRQLVVDSRDFGFGEAVGSSYHISSIGPPALTRIQNPDFVTISWTVSSPKNVQIMPNQGSGVSTEWRQSFTKSFYCTP